MILSEKCQHICSSSPRYLTSRILASKRRDRGTCKGGMHACARRPQTQTRGSQCAQEVQAIEGVDVPVRGEVKKDHHLHSSRNIIVCD